ncbi:MAG TPA: DUF4476 domain-containing protein [Chitinophagaceae bacterium]|nr:DUF4476 domain-containing protein [Chitinophagaceae bacterium]
MSRKAVLLVLCLGWLSQLAAQQEYFVFIQHEKNQPFYVRMAEKTYSSSALGHIILPKLKDSSYTLFIGFPNNQFPEHEFVVRLNKKDRGYELKNMGEKGWALFDRSDLELVSPVKNTKSDSGNGGATFIKRNDDFARLMSGVVNDTAVLYIAAVEKKAAPVARTDSTAADLASLQKKVPQESMKPDTVRAVTKTDLPVQEQKKPATDTTALVKTITDPWAQHPKNPVTDTAASVKTNTKPPVQEPVKTITDTTAIVKNTALEDQSKTGSPVQKSGKTVADTSTAKITLPQQDSSKTASLVSNADKVVADTTAKVKTDPEPVNDTVFNPPALPVIALIKHYTTDTGYYMLMKDEQDSIDIFIPVDVSEVAKNDKSSTKQDTKTKAPATKPGEKKNEKSDTGQVKTLSTESKSTAVADADTAKRNMLNQENSSKPDTSKNDDSRRDFSRDSALTTNTSGEPASTKQPNVTDSGKKQSKLVMMNSDCRVFAAESDVDKLRVKLIQEKDAAARISAAKKVFKTKCFSAAQVKALSELFPYDDQKYQFLEAAYPFVSDTSLFKELVSLLSDPVYVQRFRKLVRLD